jgi:hypothetical protein
VAGLRSLLDGPAYAVVASTVALSVAAALLTYTQARPSPAVAATPVTDADPTDPTASSGHGTGGGTATGIYLVHADRRAATDATTIDFGARLDADPLVEVLSRTDTPDTHCPGRLDDPRAAPGYLCVYRGTETAVLSIAVRRTDGSLGANRMGAVVWVAADANADRPLMAAGSWAVSAS